MSSEGVSRLQQRQDSKVDGDHCQHSTTAQVAWGALVTLTRLPVVGRVAQAGVLVFAQLEERVPMREEAKRSAKVQVSPHRRYPCPLGWTQRGQALHSCAFHRQGDTLVSRAGTGEAWRWTDGAIGAGGLCCILPV